MSANTVALLAEGVDRNIAVANPPVSVYVALLAEGVDRNTLGICVKQNKSFVALLAEGVDRNIENIARDASDMRRPPRGGRG